MQRSSFTRSFLFNQEIQMRSCFTTSSQETGESTVTCIVVWKLASLEDVFDLVPLGLVKSMSLSKSRQSKRPFNIFNISVWSRLCCNSGRSSLVSISLKGVVLYVNPQSGAELSDEASLDVLQLVFVVQLVRRPYCRSIRHGRVIQRLRECDQCMR